METPYGYCHCGCGEMTKLATHTSTRDKLIKGRPMKYLQGHQGRQHTRKITPPNPSGLCLCGCGERAPLASYSHAGFGWIKGQPKRFIHGHHARKGPVDYIEQDCGYTTACWVWQRYTAKDGYGKTGRGGKSMPAHLRYWIDRNGPTPDGLDLDHLCRNRGCVNPDHLQLATRAVNVQRGDLTKLTPEQVYEIRSRLGYRNGAALAREFGVSTTTISRIRRGKTWANLLG